MKQTRNFTLNIYEMITKIINIDLVDNKILKFIIAMFIFPLFIAFLLVALGVEEPLKCIFFMVIGQTTPKKAWEHYKKCWESLLWGIRSGV